MTQLARIGLVLLLASCGAPEPEPVVRPPPAADPAVDRTDPKLHQFVFKPSDADPRVPAPKDIQTVRASWNHDNYAYLDTRVPPVGKLAVFLVGLYNAPVDGKAMVEYLARIGFHAVAPAYDSFYDVYAGCGSADPDCKAKKRLEAFEGVDHSPHIDVKPWNSIEVRVAKMLAYLQQKHPEGGWGQFLAGDRPAWERIVISGHSHGATTAPLVAKVRLVHRVVSLSGPKDNIGGTVDPWMKSWPSKTPADRFWGLAHTAETNGDYRYYAQGWKALGVPGELIVVEKVPPPYGGSHWLMTSVPPNAAPFDNLHGSTMAGPHSPKNADGSWKLAAAWKVIFGP